MNDYFVIEPCNTANALEIKLKGRKINIEKAEKAISAIGMVMATSPVVMLTKIKEYSVSIYASGRVMVKGEKQLERDEVKKLAYEMLDALEKGNAIEEEK